MAGAGSSSRESLAFNVQLGISMRRFVSILLVMVVAACEIYRPTAPPPTPDISGSWSGPISSAVAGTGTLSVTVFRMCLILLPPGHGCQAAYSGGFDEGWSTSFSNAASNDSGSQVGAQVSGSTVILSLSPSNSGTCPLLVTATLSDSTMMHGTYTQSTHAGSAPCSGVDSGSVSLTRR